MNVYCYLRLMIFLIDSSGGIHLLSVIVQHCVWGAGAVDSCSARLALQVLTRTHSMYASTLIHTFRFIPHTNISRHTHVLIYIYGHTKKSIKWTIESE